MGDEFQVMPKMSGYLEKKGRKHMMSCYKKYWFVLEGRLLLYYKSKDEYEAISPCKGSINLGPTSNVKPCTSNIGVFQIESKTTTITLRSESREEQHKWMQALMSALNQRNSTRRLSHFRYSLNELSPTAKKPPLERQNTFPERFSNTSPEPNIKIIEKLQKMGAHSYGIGPKLQRSKTTLEGQKQMSFSEESLSSNGYQNKDRNYRKSESVIMENEEYGVLDRKKCVNSLESVDVSSEGIYERIPSSDSVFIRKEDEIVNRKSIMVDNPAYCSVERNKLSKTNDDEIIYTEPGELLKTNGNNEKMTENNAYWKRTNFAIQKSKSECENRDYNDNNLKYQNRKLSLSSKDVENIYSEAECETERNKRNVPEYADIALYAGVSPRNSSVSSQESNEDKEKKKFKGFGKKSKNQKTEEKKTKLKKSESFLQRVWQKKSKNKKNKKEISLTNENTLDKLDLPEDDTIKMLNALQEILENKKPLVMKLNDRDVEEVIHNSGKEQNNSMIYQNVLVDDRNIENKQANEDPPCPLLPPRNQKQTNISPYHDVPKAQPALPPKRKKNTGSVHLDDILDDLNKQTQTVEKDINHNHPEDDECQNNGGKVKALIRRFSMGKVEGVELRNKSNWKNNNCQRNSTDPSELDKLLDELAKVTTAPIMTPGVTSSLINPEVTDTELLRLIPVRRRRTSDPDYDIPRPHRSLTNIRKKEDNALQGTRFFGPILKPYDMENCETNRPPTPAEDYHSDLPSITPDSLEVDTPSLDLSHDENRNVSYHSHDYLRYRKSSHYNQDYLVDNNLYADPRLLHKSRNDYSAIYPRKKCAAHIEDGDNVFVDSLET